MNDNDAATAPESESDAPRRAWRVVGFTAPAASTRLPAPAGSTRVNYYCADTKEECWRQGSWGAHGTRPHSFRAYGPGRHPETGAIVAPEEEFA